MTTCDIDFICVRVIVLIYLYVHIFRGLHAWIDLHVTGYLVYAYENTCIDLFC